MTGFEGATAVVSFTLQPREAVRAGRLAARELHRLTNLAFVSVVVVGLVVVVVEWLVGGWPATALYVVLFGVFGLGMVVFRFVLPATSERQLARSYPELFDRVTTVALDDEGIHSVVGGTTIDRPWTDATGFLEDAEFVVVRQGRIPAAVIPKRAFRDRADQDAFIAVLWSHLPSADAK